MLIFLGFSLRGSNNTDNESYEVESFLQATLQYTTDCEDSFGFISIQKLIFNCEREKTCLDGRDSCEVLSSTIEELTEKSWQIEGDRPVKGYSLNITSNEQEILSISRGNFTKTSKGSFQEFSKSGRPIEIKFSAYY